MRPRKLVRIAIWEVTKNAGGIDRRTLTVVLFAMGLFVLVAPMAASGGVGLDDGIYRVSVDESSPYYDVAAADDTFRVVSDTDRSDLTDGRAELLIEGQRIEHAPSPKGLAAHEEFRTTVQRYNDRQLGLEANNTAAFPVAVTLEFVKQSGLGNAIGVNTPEETQPDDATTGPGDGTDGSGDSTDGGGDGTDDSGGGTAEPDDGTDTTADDSAGDGGATDGSDDATDGGSDGAETSGDDTGDGSQQIGDITAPLSDDDGLSGSPSDIDPPFPFQSLILAFIFVIPLNFIIQAYGSTMLSERLNRRGELLLVSPVTRLDIIGGKTLPYFLGALAIESIIAVALVFVARGELGGLLSVLAMTPLVLLFLGSTFLGAMFARSFKELTFVTVTITVGLTSYAFVPAIFTDVNAIALISPLTLVVRDLQNEAVTLAEFTFSTLPPLLAALVLFGLGTGLYREEDMFDQRAIPGKALDALAGPISKPWHVGLMTAVLIPFVFVVELLAIAVLFALGEISVVLILIVVAVVEEIGKSLHVYASFQHHRFERTGRTAVALGLFSGLGFFVAEKIGLLAQLVDLPELAIGEAGLVGGALVGPLVLLFLFLPLLLHTVTATISTLGATRGRRTYLLAVAVAIAVHFGYNLTVVTLLV